MPKTTWDMDMAATVYLAGCACAARWEKAKRDTADAVPQGRRARTRSCGELLHCARAIHGLGEEAADMMGGRLMLVLVLVLGTGAVSPCAHWRPTGVSERGTVACALGQQSTNRQTTHRAPPWAMGHGRWPQRRRLTAAVRRAHSCLQSNMLQDTLPVEMNRATPGPVSEMKSVEKECELAAICVREPCLRPDSSINGIPVTLSWWCCWCCCSGMCSFQRDHR
ncbi:hypothetical protein DE146DRAFT_782990 [Phaeosphaeria sp. MPI-PUGE-AT-0046c]|nr:hypothetical protein DE146DRAFT_782990 [Phaeosphaeria sp. MPI-PUGE-AT-0046c]